MESAAGVALMSSVAAAAAAVAMLTRSYCAVLYVYVVTFSFNLIMTFCGSQLPSIIAMATHTKLLGILLCNTN